VEEGSSGCATVGEPVSEAMGERDGEVGMAPPRRFHGAKVKGNLSVKKSIFEEDPKVGLKKMFRNMFCLNTRKQVENC